MLPLRLLWAAHNSSTLSRRRTREISRASLETVDDMPEMLFRERFRLSKVSFRMLCSLLRSLTLLRGLKEVPLELKVLCALSFLATGSDQRITGVSHHLTQRTTSRCIRQVVDALNNETVLKRWIVFPQSDVARSRIRQEFQRKFHLPGVIGCVDCTHIALVKPGLDEHLYFNRKGYHSLNVQMVCDSDLKILNVNSKFGGATHDSFVWASGQAEPYLRGLHANADYVWLLGDSGYPQRPWLMTPIVNAAPGSREAEYTRRHVKARNCIERCFGLLKSRWRCLSRIRVLHYEPQVVAKIVLACSVLHNMALEAHLPPPFMDNSTTDDQVDGPEVHEEQIESQSDLIRGRAMRNCLINRL